jgi:CRISPR-associated protein Cmr2
LNLKYLTLFTIGPVQRFIAQARKLQDLYAGSFLLSYLSKKAMCAAKTQGATILFPDPEQPAAPNRFLMTVDAEDAEGLYAFCADLEARVHQEWRKIAEKVIEETHLCRTPAVAAQIESLIQVYFASEEYRDGAQFGECYVDAIRRLGAAKTLRGFTQLDEAYGRKCTLMHEHNALFYREKRNYLVADAQKLNERNLRDLDKYIRSEETLGAVAFVKRCLKYAILEFNDAFPSVTDIYEMYGDTLNADDDKHGYYAMLMFDGDDMGKWYSEPDKKGVRRADTESFQSYLSGKVSEFAAENSRKIVNWNERKNGVVVYAGGEDFLGALNIKRVFAALRELRETFGRIDLSKYTEEKPAFSAGVVVAHVKTPLSVVLDMAREAERKAKTRSGKDAFCLTIMKRSGEVTEFVQPFYRGEKSGLATTDRLVDIIVKEDLSVKFIYQLGAELDRMAETDDAALHKEIFLAEAERVLKHSEFENKDKRDRIVKEVVGVLGELAEDTEFSLKNLLMYLRAIAFIARERGATQ